MKKLISWNVNGLRACVTKGFEDFFKDVDADIFCLQETKLQEGQIDLLLEGSSVLVLCRQKRLFGNGYVHKRRAFECMLRDRH